MRVQREKRDAIQREERERREKKYLADHLPIHKTGHEMALRMKCVPLTIACFVSGWNDARIGRRKEAMASVLKESVKEVEQRERNLFPCRVVDIPSKFFSLCDFAILFYFQFWVTMSSI